MRSGFNHDILDEVAHRPWPRPDAPWIMTQTWNDLLFAHWPVDARQLTPKIPPGIDLDLFDGQAWLGIVPFHMTNVAPRMVPALPWISAFPELNVRTYVRYHDRPGVYFFSLDAGNPVVVAAARTLFHLPYFSAEMDVDAPLQTIHFRSRRTDLGAVAEFEASYTPSGEIFEAEEGSLEYFLTERYCLYTVDDDYRALTVDIHHPPWRLQVADARIDINTMAEAAKIRLPPQAPLLHFAKRQDVVAWAPSRVE